MNYHHLPRLYFLHVLKCAGTSFRLWLNELFDTAELLDAHQPQDLQRLAGGGLPDRRFYSGHFGWWLMDLAKDAGLEVAPITILRRPEAMYRSLWRYIPRLPETESRKYGPILQGNIRAIKDNMERLTQDCDYRLHAGFWNMAVKFLVAEGPLCENPVTVDRLALETAKQHLQSMPFFGLVEEWDKSAVLFADAFKLPLRLVNRTENAGPAENLMPMPADFDHAMRRLNGFDFELYDFASGLFNNRYSEVAAKFGVSAGAPAEAFAPALKRQFTQAASRIRHVRPLRNSQAKTSSGLVTEGFLHRYPHTDGSWRLWAGPDTSSSIYLPLDRRKPLRVTLKFAVFLSARMQSELEILIDGGVTAVSKQFIQEEDGSFSTMVSFTVPPSRRHRMVYSEIEIRVPEVVHVDDPAFKSNVSFALAEAISIEEIRAASSGTESAPAADAPPKPLTEAA